MKKLNGREIFGKLLRNSTFSRAKSGNSEKTIREIKTEAEKSPRNYTIHRRPKAGNSEVKFQVYAWICAMQLEYLAISTQDIIDNALSLDMLFFNSEYENYGLGCIVSCVATD